MTEFVDAYPTARRRHRCGICRRGIEPGETYWRQAGLDRGSAWTNKTCEHCERVVWVYGRVTGEWEWEPECVFELLEDEYPAVFSAMRAGWRWPDGELAPLPFGSRCVSCGCRIAFRHLWCPPCDDARIERLNRQFAEISTALRGAS